MTSLNVKTITVGKPSLNGNEAAYVNDCLASGWLSQGEYVTRFERAFAERVGARHAVAVSNGTAALHLALIAANVKPGCEVIVPALTFVATVNAVRYCGGVPVFVDVNPVTWCVDPTKVHQAITVRTRVILPVHLYGAMANMDKLKALAISYKLTLIEDAAEALTAHDGQGFAGARGDIGCFSFYANKTITTGEGGMIVTDSADHAYFMRLLRGQGQTPGMRYWHEVLGYNYRMTDMQAAVGVAQLEQLDAITVRRAEIAKRYYEALSNRVIFQELPKGYTHGNWAVAILLPRHTRRDKVVAFLDERGVETRPAFPLTSDMPMHYTAAFLPVSRDISNRGLVLPTHAELTNEDIDWVAESLIQGMAHG